jgi:hypothetical protein
MLLPKRDMSFLRLRIRFEGTTAERIAAIGENPLQDALAGRFQLARDLIHFGVEMSDKAVLNPLKAVRPHMFESYPRSSRFATLKISRSCVHWLIQRLITASLRNQHEACKG